MYLFWFTEMEKDRNGDSLGFRYGWLYPECISRVQETKTTYVIGVGKTDAFILPKRAILTEKDNRDFENIVQSKIHGRFMPM